MIKILNQKHSQVSMTATVEEQHFFSFYPSKVTRYLLIPSIRWTYRVSLKCLNRLLYPQLAYMDALICRTRCKASVILPVDIQRWSSVEGKLLLAFSSLSIPNNCSFIHPSTQDVVPLFIPFQCKDGALVLAQGAYEVSFCWPDPGMTIIWSCGKLITITLR